MNYIIMTHGRKEMYLFLIDRTKIKNHWWSYDWNDAFQFTKLSAAQIQAKKLRFKNPKVITVDTAIKLSKENDKNYDYEAEEHPFSSEALGQN